MQGRAVSKEGIGVRDGEKIYVGEHESMSNPIFQAMLLNEARTQFDVVLVLCVGHDSLFFAEASATVLAGGSFRYNRFRATAGQTPKVG